MCIYLKNIPAKLDPEPTRNEGDFGFFEDVDPKRQEQQEQ